jgi:FkbM family methyltransferase
MHFKVKNFYTFLYKLIFCKNFFKFFNSKFTFEIDFNKRIKNKGIFRDIADCIIFGSLSKEKEEKIFLDVGANMGEFGKRIELYFGKEVFYIEPNPFIFPYLLTNIPNKKKAFKFAISDKNTQKSFYFSPKHTGGGSLHFSDIGHSKILVKCITLDNFFKKINVKKKVCAVKLDIEGHEIAALNGAKKLIKKFRPLFIVELTDSKNFHILKSILVNYKYYYVSIPGLDFNKSLILRLWGLFKTIISKKGYFLEYNNKIGFVSGLICIPIEKHSKCIFNLKNFFINDLDLLA